MNSGLNLNSIKKYINNELKFVLFKLFPLGIGLITINYVIINTYYYFKYKNFIFTKDEELLISKRIQHTMKNKLFETTYSRNTKEHLVLQALYSKIATNFDYKFKTEVYLFQSDYNYLTILPNGSLFISDNLYFLIKNKYCDLDILTYMLIHSLFHIIGRNSSKRINEVYNRVSHIIFRKMLDPN